MRRPLRSSSLLLSDYDTFLGNGARFSSIRKTIYVEIHFKAGIFHNSYTKKDLLDIGSLADLKSIMPFKLFVHQQPMLSTKIFCFNNSIHLQDMSKMKKRYYYKTKFPPAIGLRDLPAVTLSCVGLFLKRGSCFSVARCCKNNQGLLAVLDCITKATLPSYRR